MRPIIYLTTVFSVLAGFACLGCGSRDDAAFRAQWTLMEGVDFQPVERGYDGMMFGTVEITWGPTRISLLGFRPGVEYVTALVDCDEDSNYVTHPKATLMALRVDSRSSATLYIHRSASSVKVLEIVVGGPVMMANPPPLWRVLQSMENHGLALRGGELLVEERFFEDLVDKHVHLPGSALKVPVVHFESYDAPDEVP